MQALARIALDQVIESRQRQNCNKNVEGHSRRSIEFIFAPIGHCVVKILNCLEETVMLLSNENKLRNLIVLSTWICYFHPLSLSVNSRGFSRMEFNRYRDCWENYLIDGFRQTKGIFFAQLKVQTSSVIDLYELRYFFLPNLWF